MKAWLKFFGLSFFSDKIAKEAKERGVLNCVLGFVLTLVFIFCGVLAANSIPFYSHYGNATKYKSFLNNAVSNLQISVSGKYVSANRQVDTILNAADKELFSKNGYNLVIDTRPINALDDFEAYCVSKKDKSEIDYEQYLELSDEQKKDYDFKVRYTPNELVLNDELAKKHEAYLSESADEKVVKQYAELTEKKGELAADAYRLKLYTLYAKTYYPDMSSLEHTSDVPLLRSYYYKTYVNKNNVKKSLFVFSDVLLGYFDTDGGLSVTYFGSYERVPKGMLTKNKVDEFVKSVFGSSVSISANVYLMNTCKYIPLIALIPFAFALLIKLVFVLLKNDEYKKFSVCFKIECAYLAVSSLLTALVTFVCGFFVSSNVLNVLPLIIYGSILTVRTAVCLIIEVLTHKKSKTPEAPKAPQSDAQ